MDWMLSKLNSPLMLPMWYSIACGALVGLERELKNKDAGIKTTVFICVGACIFTFISLNISGSNDVSRVIAQIVKGVGFLGGGVIFKDRDSVTGLTSAAIIWMTAGIGCLIGLGYYAEAGMASLTIVCLDFGFDYLKNIFRINKDK